METNSAPQHLSQARGFLLDMDGTFYLGERLVEGALRFIEVIRGQGKDFLFLTNNSSKNAAQYAEKLGRLGLDLPQEKVLTSGEATALYLTDHYPGARLYVVGTPALEEEFLRHGFGLSGESPEAVVLGFDTGLTYARLWRLCDLVRDGIPISPHTPISTALRKRGPCPIPGRPSLSYRPPPAAGRISWWGSPTA
jgi:HAD superfamily hydrolase (TIGR01450 family)